MGFFKRSDSAPATAPATPEPAPAAPTEDKVVSLTKKAAVSLDKAGLTGVKAAVYLGPDHSGSMGRHYRDGDVQDLADRVLGLSRNLDDDGDVPVAFWDSVFHPPFTVSLNNYQGVVQAHHAKTGWGGTNYALAIKGFAKLHKKESKGGGKAPGLVIIQTDGQPDSESAAERALIEVSGEPLFYFFVGFGDPYSYVFDFLKRLDNLTGRKVDNAAFFPAGRDPQNLDVTELYDAIVTEYKKYLAEASAAGIL